jgi:C-terminal processing protease CtpA/Prc
LTKKDGPPFTVIVSPAFVKDNRMVSMYNAPNVPVTLYRKKLSSFYWYEYLPDTQAIYVQYNRCANDPALSMASFAQGLFAFTDSHTVKRVIIDLRFNGGGDSAVISPLLKGLKDRASIRSNLRVLIGPATFSSAQFAAFALRRELHALLVGEPTGENLNGYGEVRLLVLPESQLTIQYSTKFFRLVKDSDAQALEPDIRASATLDDVLAGRDPVLEAALR